MFELYLLSTTHLGYILTFTCFDAFGFGALLAWYHIYHPSSIFSVYKWLRAGAIICIGLLIIQAGIQFWYIIPLRTIIAVITTWLIAYIIIHSDKPTLRFGIILNNPALIFLGKISYGIYLYHNLIPTFNRIVIAPIISSVLPADTTAYYRIILFTPIC